MYNTDKKKRKKKLEIMIIMIVSLERDIDFIITTKLGDRQNKNLKILKILASLLMKMLIMKANQLEKVWFQI